MDYIKYITNNDILKNNKYEIIKKNYKEEYIHGGLIHYIYYCLNNNFGIILRPDMFWYCILFEFSKHISENKHKYSFNYKLNEKIYDNYLKNDELFDMFKKTIIYEEIYNLLIKDTFISEPKHFIKTKILTFINLNRFDNKKYYVLKNNTLRKKNIKYNLKGSKEDWIKLKNMITILINFINDRLFITYLENCKKIITNLITNYFIDMISDDFLRFQNISDMMNNILIINKNKINGWICELYFNNFYNNQHNIEEFDPHICYISYVNRNTKELCINLSGLNYSIRKGLFIEASYGDVLLKTEDTKTFVKLLN